MKLRAQIVLAGALAAGCFANAQQPAPSKTVDPTRQSQSFSQEMSPQPAGLAAQEAALRSQLTQKPHSADLLYSLAQLLREEQKYRESLETYTQAAALQPPSATQLRSVALDYVQLNDFNDAIRWLRVALGLEPNNVDILYSLGRCFYTQNDFAHAEISFQRVLQLHPDHLKAEENLGLTYDARNQPELAERALRTAVSWSDERHITDPWPYIDLGTLLLDQSRPQEAIPFLQKAAQLAPASAPAHLLLGRALLGKKQAPEAATELEQAAKLDPQNAKVHYELGRAYRESGQPEKARAEFERGKALYGYRNQD